MGTSSYVLAGAAGNEKLAFSSACHGAGRRLSRTQARKQWRGAEVLSELARMGITALGHSKAGLAEEAPGAYKNIEDVVEAATNAGLRSVSPGRNRFYA